MNTCINNSDEASLAPLIVRPSVSVTTRSAGSSRPLFNPAGVARSCPSSSRTERFPSHAAINPRSYIHRPVTQISRRSCSSVLGSLGDEEFIIILCTCCEPGYRGPHKPRLTESAHRAAGTRCAAESARCNHPAGREDTRFRPCVPANQGDGPLGASAVFPPRSASPPHPKYVKMAVLYFSSGGNRVLLSPAGKTRRKTFLKNLIAAF